MSTNRSAQRIPQTVIDQTKALLADLRQLWQPYLLHLDPEEQKSLAKMGARKLPFALSVRSYMRSNAPLVPAYLDAAAFDADMANSEALLPLQKSAQQLVEELDNLLLISNSEAYDAALAFYANVQSVATRLGDASAQAISVDLSQHFASRGRKKKAEPAV
jgi:hypothetical protein